MCASLMLLVGMVMLVRKLWRLHHPQYPFLERDPVLGQVKDEKGRISKYSLDEGDLQNAVVVFSNRDSQEVHMY